LDAADCMAPLRLNWDGMPLTRCVELRFLTSVIWKHDAEPWREMMVEYARKYSQMRNQRSPYLATTFSLLATQLRYQRQMVA